MSTSWAATSGDQVQVPVAFNSRYRDAENVDTFNSRIGRCYELALRAQLVMAELGWETTLVHGTIGPASNPHAWLEWRDKHGRRLVWDGVFDGILPGTTYRDEYFASIWTRYSPRAASRALIAADNNGPWGRDVQRSLAVIEDMVSAGINPEGGLERIAEILEQNGMS